MVESEYTDAARWARDNEITELVQQYRRENPHGGGGNTTRMAILNNDGAVYRVVETTGMGTMIYFGNNLFDLGLRDQLADGYSMKDGFDCIWETPDQ